MKFRGMRILVGGLCLGLACTLAAPSQAQARGHGAWAWALPLGAAAVVIAGLTYYSHAGVYYRPAPGGYVVVPPPAGVVVSPAAPMEGSLPSLAGAVVVASPSLNVRSGPGMNYPVVTVVGQGQILEVSNSSQGWLAVRTPSGHMGWVAQQFTSPAAQEPQG
jgi:uncharacterized protein YgiM (DUF1202 family)